MAAKSGMRNVQRIDHHHFHGWLVCLKRAGTRHERYLDAPAATKVQRCGTLSDEVAGDAP